MGRMEEGQEEEVNNIGLDHKAKENLHKPGKKRIRKV
jgi:hypothetical protein